MRLRPLLFIIVGITLLVWGFLAADSISSSFSEIFTGAPTDQAIWLILGGAVSTTWGLIRLGMGRPR